MGEEYLREWVENFIKEQIKTLSYVKDEIAKDTDKSRLYLILDGKILELQEYIKKEEFKIDNKIELDIFLDHITRKGE